MKSRNVLVTIGVAAGLFATACGSGDSVPIAAPSGDSGSEAAANASPVSAAATVQSSDLGDVLAGANGLTLYGFTNDVDATSTCYGTCADAWPPVIVDADFAVAPGLDVGIFATTERDDGSLQLVAGKWPLYFFAGDAVPGDLAGQASGDVWFAVDPSGSLITADSDEAGDQAADLAATTVSTGATDLGDVLVNSNGLSLYGFTEDVDGAPTCDDACADAWPPIVVPNNSLPDGLDSSVFSVVERSDGTFQLSAGVWPLYLFAGDGAPGDVNGQGSGDVWFLATPEGGLIRNASEAPAEDAGESEQEDDRY